jgi:hypothetical protein
MRGYSFTLIRKTLDCENDRLFPAISYQRIPKGREMDSWTGLSSHTLVAGLSVNRGIAADQLNSQGLTLACEAAVLPMLLRIHCSSVIIISRKNAVYLLPEPLFSTLPYGVTTDSE